MAEGTTSSVGSAGGFSSPGLALPAVASAVANDAVQSAFAKGGLLRTTPINAPEYSLNFRRNPYDIFSDRGFDRRQAAGFDYVGGGSQMMSRPEARASVYGNSVSLYSRMMGVSGQGYSGGGGGAGQGVSYPRNNFVGCSSGSVDYTGQ